VTRVASRRLDSQACPLAAATEPRLAMIRFSLVLCCFAIACSGAGAATDPSTQPSGVACADVGFPGISAQVRDLDGRPVAAGATVTVRDGKFVASAVGTNALSIGLANNRAGTYAVSVAKPYYATTSISSVVVPGGPCGATRTVVVPIPLALQPNAPPIRSVTVLPSGAGLGLPGMKMQYSTIIDAAGGADTTVRWTLSDTVAATIDANGLLTTKCTGAWHDLKVIATSHLDPTKSGTGTLTVMVTASQSP
jgi:hypothetical protein